MSREEVSLQLKPLEIRAIRGLIRRYEKRNKDEENPDIIQNLKDKVEEEIGQ